MRQKYQWNAPKKTKKILLRKEEKTHNKNTIGCKPENTENLSSQKKYGIIEEIKSERRIRNGI